MNREARRAQHNQRVQGYRDRGLLTPEELDAMTGGPRKRWPGFQPPGTMGDDELDALAALADGPGTAQGNMSAEELDRMARLAGGGRR